MDASLMMRWDVRMIQRPERRVRGPPHLTHAALAKGRGDLVDAETSAWGEGQRWELYERDGQAGLIDLRGDT